MYAAIDKRRKKYIAFHEDRSVVDDFIRGTNDPSKYILVKIKKKAYNHISDTADLHIVDYNGQYIQHKYLESASFFIDGWDYDERTLIGRLEWLSETDPDLSNKDLKALNRVVDILRRHRNDSKHETIDIDMLEEMKLDYDQYQGSVY